MSDSLLTSLFRHKAWANRSMFEVLMGVPEENRGAIAMPLLVLAHASLVDRAVKARLLDGEPESASVIPTHMPELNELAETVSQTDAWYIDYVGAVTDAELARTVAFVFLSDGDKGHMTKQDMLVHVLTHAQSHRAQVAAMLDKASIRGRSDMFTTFLSEGRSN
jgi:uncharacterized damage-inducible protein DinB